jgi:LPXTG-site transpeptidase (sortase) family protein
MYLLAVALIISGAAALYFGFYGRSLGTAPQPSIPAAAMIAPSNVATSGRPTPRPGTGTPVHITIPDVAIDLPVANGVYNPKTKQWTLGNDRAYFAETTTKPNATSGETFMYGHNRSSVFGRLPRVKPGNMAYITTDSQQRFSYRLRNTYTTRPDDTTVLAHNSGPPTLVLQTCTGAAFQNRTMFVFDFVEVSDV